MLCQKCRQRQAVIHLTEIRGDVIKKTDLCVDCHVSDSPESKGLLTAVSDANCEYCGEQPCVGGLDVLGIATGNPRNKFLCYSCSQEHSRYIQQHLSTEADDLSRPEQLALLKELDQKADQHMQQWIAKKRGAS